MHSLLLNGYCREVNKSGVISVVAVSPPVNSSVELPIVLQLDDANDTRVHTGETFQYRDDPIFTDIQPRNHLVVSVTVSSLIL